ncbi:E3 ubiquitin-protein ligase XIAP-like [Haliotis rufescens]|uniref:E3 ubiquitin-protein ligase XIAP-like n=1 Tax=Haliotis rufescens TaxID=6454 RepID=UPI00201E7C2C|nr:E3 ubiquitin-protein ligase XIAP-like [Haliotis rufescens]XP_046344486.2 E3 ubiquitin-protein ligase XIAP-like [Haliotis rufescens]XP_046344487.2 E3 ubiquitin-protein ligase XIAP-like [Haliotis rufescens]XP_046344488.2 E3 ubiquitin-protein ligase XIAP-like [Haliotis rufescens]XP_046344489.2 E3 ubiquitin-protein ligase XIAP-like [Haliotis rufescens]XP_046344490.2 E3 ubiquitin-protein ligase XIAP-like [Haliotis rufescens]XP_048239765.1 E3 ubiquitin-protein ligase XIAP-like [Haliotis rufescen
MAVKYFDNELTQSKSVRQEKPEKELIDSNIPVHSENELREVSLHLEKIISEQSSTIPAIHQISTELKDTYLSPKERVLQELISQERIFKERDIFETITKETFLKHIVFATDWLFYICSLVIFAVNRLVMSALENQYFRRLLSGEPMSTGEEMKFELLRLKTFAGWMLLDRASPIRLAKAGFIYTGNEDVVKCFSCDVVKGGWSRNMNPMLVHRELNPSCSFFQEADDVNIPVFVPQPSEYQEIQNSLHRQYCGTDSPAITSSSFSNRPEDNPDYSSATFRQNQATSTQTNFPVVATDSGAAETSRQAIGTARGLGLGHDSEATPTREEFAPMKKEANRFSSFDANWPRQNTPDPRDLARAGFYFTGTVDRVQCVFCRGILRNWDEDDVPMEEHRRHFPMCPYVMGLDVGNVPDPVAIISANRTSEFMNVTQPAAVVSDASLGIVTDRPRHPQYAVEASRVSSFRNWPSGKEQTPQMLAKAGFFYAGFGDSVKCFYCDGGLRTWERGDDPWSEHARWFPRCPYVRQVKGDNFIQTALGGREPATSTSGNSTSSTSQQLPNSATNKKAVRTVDPRELSARMDSPMVQTVLKMDIPRDRVARAIQNRLQETGDDFASIEALMDAIFHLPDGEQSAPETPKVVVGASSQNVPAASGDDKGEKCDDSSERTMDDDDSSDEDSQSLMEENRQLKEQRQCKICMDEEVNVVFLPCGHLVCCATCAPALRKCPICRANIRGTVRTFMS